VAGGALLSKGAALPVLAALLLLDIYPLRRVSRVGWPAVLGEKTPLLLVTLAAAMIIGYATGRGAGLTGSADYDTGARLTLAAYSFVASAARFFWPTALSPLYEMPLHVSPLEGKFALAVIGLVVVTALLIVLRRRWPAGLAAWAYSLLMLAPIGVAVRKTTDLAPDRYSYLAGLGFALLVGGAVLGVFRLVERGTLGRPMAWVTGVAGLAAITGLGATSWSYSEIWREPETLWRWAIDLDPACSVCHSKLGKSILGDPARPQRAPEAEALFRRAIALRPDRPHPYFNLGTALLVQGRPAEAEAPLRGYLERAPWSANGADSRARDTNNDEH
jgi:hypothetical protein